MQSPLPWPRFCLLHIHGMCRVCQIFTLLSGIGPHQLLQMLCTFCYPGEMKTVFYLYMLLYSFLSGSCDNFPVYSCIHPCLPNVLSSAHLIRYCLSIFSILTCILPSNSKGSLHIQRLMESFYNSTNLYFSPAQVFLQSYSSTVIE